MRLVLLALLLHLPAVAIAKENTTSNFLKDYDDGDAKVQTGLREIIRGFYVGMSWTNQFVQAVQKQPAVYCAPGKMVMTSEQLVEILRSQAKDNKVIADAPVALGLLYSIRAVFPCP